MKNQKEKKTKVRDLVYIAVMAAIIAVCSWISIPGELPFTLQTMGVFCAVGLLGGKRGTAAVAVYVLLGAVGLPVFSGFTGGLWRLMGATGGYIVGFLLGAAAYWLLTALLGTKAWAMALGMGLALLICYAFGTVWYVTVYAAGTGGVGFALALSRCVAPFILPDLAKLGASLLIVRSVSKRIEL